MNIMIVLHNADLDSRLNPSMPIPRPRHSRPKLQCVIATQKH